MKDIVIRELGRGGCGKVYLVNHDGNILARKRIKITGSVESVEKEVQILKEMKNRNILILEDSLYDELKKKYYIYTEYLKKGDLWNIIDENKEIVSYVKDLVNGLKYIHSKGIIHRDLKPGNILVGDHNELVISDFGLAIENEMVDIYLAGTRNYIAPELWLEKPPPYSTASDIFSLGCVVYEIYSLKNAYKGTNTKEVGNEITSDKELVYERKYGERIPEIEELIKKMLEKDVNKRIKLTEIEEEINRISYSINPQERNESELPTTPILRTTSTVEATNSKSYCNDSNETSSNCPIEGKMLSEISEMNKEEFKSYWNNDLIPIFFPDIKAENSQYTEEDSEILKSKKEKFINNLHKLIDLCDHSQNLISSILKFLDSIEDSEYIEKLKLEKKHKDYRSYFWKGKNYHSSVNNFELALTNSSTNEERLMCHENIFLSYFYAVLFD